MHPTMTEALAAYRQKDIICDAEQWRRAEQARRERRARALAAGDVCPEAWPGLVRRSLRALRGIALARPRPSVWGLRADVWAGIGTEPWSE